MIAHRRIILAVSLALGLLVACGNPRTEGLPTATPIPPQATARPSQTTPSTAAPSAPAVTQGESAVSITYTCNDGFIIAYHGKKVLIDALFHDPGVPCYADSKVVAAMTQAQPPFDGADLVLITHEHRDHFEPQVVGAYLQNNPRAVLVSMPAVIDELKQGFSGFDQVQDRVRRVPLPEKESVQMTIAGIELEIISAPADVPNLGFLMRIDGLTLFHSGDSAIARDMRNLFQSYNLTDKGIDLAFVPWPYLAVEWYRQIVYGIRAKNYVPMHFAGDDTAGMSKAISAYFPQAILFREEMQTWVYSPPAAP